MNELELLNDFLSVLGRGGNYQYFTDVVTHSIQWFEAGKMPGVPNWNGVWFGVHPSKQTLEFGKRGGIENVAAINCLFSEFDMKDGCTYETIENLQPKPSVVIASGGGWHCYWLLDKPIRVAPDNIEDMRTIQYKWVAHTGGDSGAKDLARVLRIPGTLNNKYSPAKPVEFIISDFHRKYSLDALREYIQVQYPPHVTAPIPTELKENSGRSEPSTHRSEFCDNAWCT